MYSVHIVFPRCLYARRPIPNGTTAGCQCNGNSTLHSATNIHARTLTDPQADGDLGSGAAFESRTTA
jgi:hypothetical protein